MAPQELRTIIAVWRQVQHELRGAVYAMDSAKAETAEIEQEWDKFHYVPLFTKRDEVDFSTVESIIRAASDALESLLARLDER